MVDSEPDANRDNQYDDKYDMCHLISAIRCSKKKAVYLPILWEVGVKLYIRHNGDGCCRVLNESHLGENESQIANIIFVSNMD